MSNLLLKIINDLFTKFLKKINNDDYNKVN